MENLDERLTVLEKKYSHHDSLAFEEAHPGPFAEELVAVKARLQRLEEER